MEKICYIFLLFLMYSFIGWIIEMIDIYIEERKIINRGFCVGPYCPIYGIGVLLIVNFLKDYTDSWLVLFVMSMFICMVLEYFTSFVMEKLFKARWWDYSNKKFNLNGRICLETTIPFGLGGLIVMYIVNPFLEGILNLLSSKAIIILGIGLMVLFVSDLVISFIAILKVRNVRFDKIKDSTEEMNMKVREYLMKHSFLTRRLMQSFPNLKFKIEKFKNRRKKDNKSK